MRIKLLLSLLSLTVGIFLAVGFSQTTKTNVEATLLPPDFEKARALIARGGCSACHSIPAIEGAVAKLGPSWCEPATEFQAGQVDLEFIMRSIVDPLAKVDAEFNPVMPTNFGETFDQVELTTLVSFIATLNCSQ